MRLAANFLENVLIRRGIGSFEAGEILKKMKNNKSPGSDGFTSEFLTFFCIMIDEWRGI
jgi:hypothetical protein